MTGHTFGVLLLCAALGLTVVLAWYVLRGE